MSSEPGNGAPRGRRRQLEELSREVVAGSRYVALEGDRWFLTAVRGLDKGAQRTKSEVSSLGRYLANQSLRLRPGWARPKTARERIRRLLRAEAKRLKLDVPENEFDAFSEKMATFLELVLSGAVPVDAVAFECADEPATACEHPCTSRVEVNEAGGAG